MSLLKNLTPIQWAAIVGAVALLVLPRLTALKDAAGSMIGLFRKAETAPDIHAKVDAYRTLAADLPTDLAKQVWSCIQSSVAATGTEATHADG
jgi:hypothetical protein